MTSRTLIAHVVFAALALAFAWQRAHSAEARGATAESVVLFDAKAGDVSSVSYSWPGGSTVVSPQGGGPARVAIVELDRQLDDGKADAKQADAKQADAKEANARKAAADKEAASSAAASSDAGPEGTATDGAPDAIAAPPAREKARFPGGRSVMASMDALEPLKSRRSLGEVDAARLKAMGLEAPERSLTVTTSRGATLVLDVGEQAYGGQGRYVRVRGEQGVHLVDPALITGLEATLDALLEKRIMVADVADVTGFKAISGDRSRVFIHADREQPQKRRFVPQDDPASTDEAPGKLMTGLRNLRGTRLVAEGELTGGSVVAVLQVELAGRSPVVVEVVERGSAGYAAKVGPWAWQVSETQARELVEDVSGVVD